MDSTVSLVYILETCLYRFTDFEDLNAGTDDLFASRRSLHDIWDYLGDTAAAAADHTRGPSLGAHIPLLFTLSLLRRCHLASSTRSTLAVRSHLRLPVCFTLLVPDKGWIMYSPTSEQTSMQPEWQISLPSEPGHESTSAFASATSAVSSFASSSKVLNFRGMFLVCAWIPMTRQHLSTLLMSLKMSLPPMRNFHFQP